MNNYKKSRFTALFYVHKTGMLFMYGNESIMCSPFTPLHGGGCVAVGRKKNDEKMKVSCAYCGRIHEKTYDCGRKPKRVKKRYEKEAFRSTAEWQRKAEEIKDRDHYLCQICFRNLYHTTSRLTSSGLSVHHAIPLKEAYELRLVNANLLTLCDKHHKMADSGQIPLEKVLEVINVQT